MLRFHCFSWKRYNFHRLKDIICDTPSSAWRNYFPDSFSQSVVDPPWKLFIFRKSIRFEIEATIKYDCMFLSCHISVSEWIHTLQLPEYRGPPCSKLSRNLKLVWRNGWVFFFELSGFGFESSCSDIKFVFRLLLTLLPYKLNIAVN